MNEATTAWILTSTALVLFMTLPGLALFYAGLVRSKNVLSVLAQCFGIACIASIVWIICGYSIAFNGDGEYFGNLDKLFLNGVSLDSLSGDIPETLFVMFQMTFAIITPALIVGAYVERIKFISVMMITILWLIIVYAPVTHWIWGGGWLANMGVLDFAGGLVVHTTAGVSALVIVYYLGSRNGFPNQVQPPHSPVLAMIGAAMLWIGWFGFNAGSAIGANANAAMAMLVTHISAAVATITWMFMDISRNGKPGLVGMITGMVAGLATVTPASGFIGPMGAIILGISSGIICYIAVGFIKNKLNLDDSLDVFAVHGVGGIIGTMLAGVLAAEQFGGLGLETSVGEQTYIQFVGVISVALYTLIATIIITSVVRAIFGLRIDGVEEDGDGVDVNTHGESGYNL
ncbi:MAG: ammonium transporter [Thiotrichaceae bacterium]|nr:ammonium transporter [Pseudomonadota bacterium]GIR93241.1 MAG: ammonium transporter [Thiotrichaceae bacterium]|tara:strand:+ start:112 stop:1317 length:1206 start_codon:yes stop_codon:yes gene_type:complete